MAKPTSRSDSTNFRTPESVPASPGPLLEAGADDWSRPADAPDLSGPAVLEAALKTLPGRPGVYRMLGEGAEVLYVGKARNLKKRVSAYAQGRFHTNRIGRMVHETRALEIIETQSETEALLLESNLIKRLKPRYNVILRDDKSFPYILITADHAFPQIVKHRGARNRQGEYFGPFASAKSVNRTLNTLQKAFLLRSCSDHVLETRTRPCLLFQIKRCSAPCVDYIDAAGYAALVDEARGFLTGKSQKVKQDLSADMEKAADAMEFERAAGLRDRIRALSHVQLDQRINPETFDEADVIAATRDGGQVSIQVFFYRSGQNWGNRAYFPRHDKADGIEEVLEAFVGQFYDNKPVPKLILTNHELPGAALLAEALSLRADRKVTILTPQRGEKRSLVEHAEQNAREALARRLSEEAQQTALLEALADLFKLDAPPERIEIYDNSHIQGSDAVGAMVVAGPEGFDKREYRTFNIKNTALTPGDDFGMMREMLTRRFSRMLKAEEAGETPPRPDLLLIDGGKGQLSSVHEVLDELGVDDIAVVGISKGPDRNAGREQFHIRGQAPQMIEAHDPVLHYLQRLRDEAHRFAIGTHRARRGKARLKNPLDEIEGIGPTRKRALLHHFGSARAVERAALSDLEAVEGISKTVAQRIYDHFRQG